MTDSPGRGRSASQRRDELLRAEIEELVKELIMQRISRLEKLFKELPRAKRATLELSEQQQFELLPPT